MPVELMWQACHLEFEGNLKIRSISQWSKLNLLSGLPGGSDGKESACKVGDLHLIPGEGKGYPLRHSCLENPHGQRCLAGYSLWGLKESDAAERLSTAQHT